MRQLNLKENLSIFFLLALLTGLIFCPLITVFAKAVINDDRLSLYLHGDVANVEYYL